MSQFEQSPSQTIGPFFHNALIQMTDGQNVLVNEKTAGQKIIITGLVLDGDGQPVEDSMVEIWQADANGYFNHPADPNQAKSDPEFMGHGRSQAVDAGRFSFTTVKPGIIAGEATPYINLRVFARGMLIHAISRIYFSDETTNKSDAVLNSVPAERRDTLVAKLDPAELIPTYRLDLNMQGENETVFFNP